MTLADASGNHFTRGKNCWRASTFWAAAKGRPSTELKTSLFRHNARVYAASFSELLRVLKADLAYPIIVDKDLKILDGYHRVAKAKLLRKKLIKAILLEDLPRPDWTQE